MPEFSKLSGPPDNYGGTSITIFLNMRSRWWSLRDQPREFVENLPKQWRPGRLGQVKLGFTWGDFRDTISTHHRAGLD